ncbi:MAG TPA: VOC family protein [Candidatus Aquilonibacter sp.]|nr:VOC family protein [Candidatus Aquilonibacter sp.]
MPATTTTLIKGIDIAGFLVKDPAKAIAFYRDVLGIEPTEIDSEGRGAEFTLADGTTFGVWRPEDGATGGFIMFAVDDINQAVSTLRERGVQLPDPMETPVCHMTFAQDPEGNGYIVHQRKQ